jgi:hypothetical protein
VEEFEKRETVLEPRSHESIIKTGSTGLTGLHCQTVKIQSKRFFFSRDDPIIYGGIGEDSYILPRIH